MYDEADHQAERINHDMALAAFDLLPRCPAGVCMQTLSIRIGQAVT
jgi:hypothetical protein